jgi:putative transcriptional regulator
MTKRKTTYGSRLIASLGEAVAIERGDAKPAAVARHKLTAKHVTSLVAGTYPPARVQKIRKEMRLSQPVFAGILNVSPETVRAWEQGKRSPEGAALRLLEVTEHHPRLMLQTIRGR